ncbi:hypothetical protein K437DRAFT_272549 [Tilletiaria anomala UBC 951]|uniref:Peptidase A22B, signal peptide peptidase n=1 Tax=Tilletiaria anomala (strain ATCC 24038 / CBS 436.72 / UBC 951) TaxID=1037660 RepID=A0A066WIK0_TILAU|nr:uncharacterized protein K437DRAFT_272549 [Tilletiaria anomala UBC 951]KDN52343.1 hypothetical protein K437DRAFT_272549 [Tilletiaria anomala UBC 951]
MSQHDVGLFTAYGALMIGAIVPIYYGSLASLKTPKTTRELRKQLRKRKKDDAADEAEDEDEDDGLRVGEKVTSEDAWLFPVFGSAVLFGMYLVFRYLDKQYVNLLLSFYFGVLGFFSLSKAFRDVLHAVLGRKIVSRFEKIKVEVSKAGRELLIFTCSYLDLVVLVPLSLFLVVFYIITRHWIVSNLLALSLALNAIALMEIDSFLTGSIMLGGLFVYDVFWVFGTDVMVSVARNFDAPIKIVWPKNLLDGLAGLLAAAARDGRMSSLCEAWSKLHWQFTMLGLGDIVIPGIFVALALRYDQHVASVAAPSVHFTRRYTSFPKPYFTATLIAYVAGLATTMAVMHVFKAAQPALLYLSPACVSAVALQSFKRGEWKQVWSWKDTEEDSEGQEQEQAHGSKEIQSKDSRGKSLKAATKSSNGDAGTATDGGLERRSSRKRRQSVKTLEADI